MKHTIRLFTAVALLLITATASAHGPVSEPKNGGVVASVNDVEYELVVKSDSIALYVENHRKMVDVAGASAKVTLLAAGEKNEVHLSPAGANKLEAKGAFKAPAGTKVVTVVQLPGMPAATARFQLK